MAYSILIVDDKKANIDMLTAILKDDYTLMAAISGESAIKLLERKSPDLVLLDIFMPGIDGFGVLRYIKGRKELAAAPVIFVTGEHDEKVEEKGIAMGAVDCVKKPYNAKVVLYKVRNHLALKAYRDDLERQVEKRTQELNASREAIIMGMSLMSESHDPVSHGHIERIKQYTKMMTDQILIDCPELLTPENAAQIVLCAPLHDIGKIEIPDEILSMRGGLSPEQYSIMQSHAEIGGELLRKTEMLFFQNYGSSDLRTAMDIAENHHEHYDGSGYPHGLKGDEIPLPARIVSLVDAYDGLRCGRRIRKSCTHEEAVDIILNENAARYDPLLLQIFDKIKDKMLSHDC